jgi:CrcB protein
MARAVSSRPIRWGMLPLVCAGGALGVAARYALTAPLDVPRGSGVVWATLAINLLGSLLLGVLVGALGDRHPRWRAFLGTGVLGGFTTYSAFAVQLGGFGGVLTAVSGTDPLAVALGVAVPLALGLVVLLAAGTAALLGLSLGGWIARRGDTGPGEPA